MFAENRKISGRQSFRLLTYDLLGLGTLLMPTVLAGVAGQDGIFCILLGTCAGLFYHRLLASLVRDMKISFPAYLEQKLGVVFGKIVEVFYFIYFTLLAGYTAWLFSSLVLKQLLREESFWLILVVLILMTAYGLWNGIEGRARVYEILFWAVMLPLFVMLFAAADEIDTDYWAPVFVAGSSGILQGTYYVFMCLALVFLVLFLGEFVEKKEGLIRAGRSALIFAGTVHAGLYLILLGIFGVRALSVMEFPAVTMMSTVKIATGFLKRLDAFMFGIWFFTLYALFSSAVFYGGIVLNQLVQIGKIKKWKAKPERTTSMVLLVAVFVVAGLFYGNENVTNAYEWFLWYVGTPVIVLIPLVLVLRNLFAGKVKTGKWILLFVLVPFNFVSGCQIAELEDKNFPIEVAVNKTGDFGAQWLGAKSVGNQKIDYNHLKVVILSKAFLEDAASMEEFLNLLETRNEVPRNTYVVVADDAKKMIALGEEMEESVGTYLEEYMENTSQVKKDAYPTLGMLYQEKENRLETLFLPFIKEVDGKPQIDHFYVWQRGAAVGEVDMQTAFLAFFTANQLEEYTLMTKTGGYVKLFEPRNEISFSEENGRQIVVDISCNGEVLGQNTDVKKAEREIAEYMNSIAAYQWDKRMIDVSNSFKKLGGYQRDWYFFYENVEKKYEEELDIVYRLHITWVNL